MADLTTLRARLKDRRVKVGALGKVEVAVCLDQALILELRELEAERDRVVAFGRTAGDPGSLAGVLTKGVDTSDLDAQIEVVQQSVDEATVRLMFCGISAVRYQELVDRYEDPEVSRAAFMNDLCGVCLTEAWSGDDQVGGEDVAGGLTWEEIYPQILFGEWDNITTQVFALNKRVLDVPLLRKTLRATARAGTPEGR